MKKIRIIFIILFTLISVIFTQFSCNNNSNNNIVLPINLNASFPLLTQKHVQYYQLEKDARSIQIVFDHDIMASTADDNIDLCDVNGTVKDHYELIVDGKIVFLEFHNDYDLNGGWKYDLSLTEGLLSKDGHTINGHEVYEFRTTSTHIHDYTLANTTDTTTRTLIACISDIHCGDQRAIDGNYSWFKKNADVLTDYLEYVDNHPNIKELVLLGDLFDEWMVPYNRKPFDSNQNINSSKDYFKAIANASINQPIFKKLSDISSGGIIDVIYVPGNHDMLITQEIIEELIPNVKWKSDVTGLGKYNPVDEIHMEHGHRFDFFNCPQPLINEGQILPPGYFVTRLYASGLASRQQSNKNTLSIDSDIEFITAWAAAFGYTIADFGLYADTIQMDSSNVLMTGIDGYNSNMSFNYAREMYATDIEELWPQTQEVNNVPNSLSVFLAILNGTYLYGATLFEYLTDYFSTDQPKIVAFGHSHEPEIKVFPFEHAYTGIYANSGSWIDAGQSKYKVRTFLIINPGNWSGSELDVVTLYQYNLNNDSGSTGYKPEFIKEESIKH